MKREHRIFALIIAVPGIVACLLALSAFLLKILRNDLPWHPRQSVRDHYLAVSQAFSLGFGTGFFLCFFLMLVAVAVGTWFDQRRERRRRTELTAKSSAIASPSAV